MPITEPLSIADVFAAAENDDPTQIADNAALRQQFNNRFAFDPEVSLWDENELKKKQKMQALREAAQRNKETVNPFLENQTEENKKIVMDDLDTLGGIGAGIGGLNIKNMSSAEIQDKILSITPKLNPQRGNISKKYLEQKKRAAVYGPDVASGIRGMTAQPESLNQKPIDRQRAEPSQEEGNRYTKAVKRGAANMLQTVALLHDFGYLGFERGMEAIGGKNIGQPIDSGLEPTQNKLFRTMEELKQERYQVSSENYNLITGAKNAAEQAESEGSGGTTAALSYLIQNGTFGDMGEFLAEVVPSLGFGLGAGALARRSIGAAAERIVAKKAGSIARRAGETVDAARLAKFAAPVGGAIQGATIAATTDFAGSAGAEYSAQYNEGKNMGESIDYALRRSLAQAGVSGLGGSLLPMQFGNRLYTSVVQSAVQGVAGYASAAAGAAAVGEELAPEEAALNILMGVVTALPETIAVAGGEVVSRNQIMREVEEGLIDQSLQNKAVQEDEANVKAAYLAGVMGDVVNRLKESKTAGRSEATVREFINSVREENEAVDAVYMDVESFNQTLDRYNVPLEDIFEMSPEIARQWERVEDIEGTIRIPLDELLSVAYKIDNDPLIKDILNSMRSDPLAPNAREANESLSRTAEEMKTDVKSIMENYEKIRLEQDDLASVQQLIRDDLKALEFGFEQKTGFNEQASTLVAAMYDSLAKKMGIPARDLYNSMPVRIVSNDDQARITLGEMDVESFNQDGSRLLGRNDFQSYIKEKYSIDLGLTGSDSGNTLTLQKIIVPDSARGTGVGTQAMNEIIAYADANNKRLALTPSSDFGGNKKRLIDFYKRFGFVENKGKNKDFEISEAMYRDSSDIYNQANRGQIQFRKDKKGAVIIMGKNADFSTFAHEMGHHFLELNMAYARRPDAPEQLKADMETVMKWAGLDSDLGTWNSLTPEQKTEVHEKFAESFESYMFTGKSPSNALREVFARFRTFMTAVYKNMARFMGINPRADLNPEITAVMDRLVATQDAIEEVQRQRNLEMLITPEMATELGIPFKEYDEMRQDHEAATEAAINELEQKTIKDLAWYRNLRNKHVSAFNSQAKRVRQQMREIAAKEVAEMPVYQAIAYLRQPVEKAPKVARNSTVVDTAVDNLLEAIAKYGGIDADEIASTWGTDKPESYKVNVGRVKKVARKGGLSIETVAERLAEDGYLQKDQYGQFDTRELEDLFTDSLSGGTYYSMYADFELFHHGDDYGLAMGELPAFPDAAKLNLEWIKAKYGEDSAIYNAIPKNGKYALASLDGFDPEAIASRFGYESADKMIREIVDAPAPKELIEQKSGELMQEGYSDLFDENAVNQAIDEAVHNDIRAQMLAREMAAIGKMNGRHAELNAAAKAVAGNIISKSLVRDIRPSVFSATELRLARQYDKALRSGDTVEAARIKRNQLVNFHAAKRAHEVQAQIKSLKDLEQKVFGSDERLSKARDFNYVTLARAVMGMFDLSARQSDYVDQLNMIKEYDFIAWTELTDLVQGLPELKDYRDLTHAELDVVDAAIRQIWYLSKESQKFTVEGKRVERAAVIEELSKQADTKPVRSRVYKGPGSGNPKFQRTASNFISAIGHLRRAEQFFTWMDGGKSNGVFHKYLFNPIQDALTNYRLAQREMKKEILDIYSQFDKHEGKIDATEIGYTFNSKQDLLHAILHSGNESNKQRLVLGRQWGEQLEDGSIDYSRWDNFVQRMMNEGIVTKNDMDAVQRIWNLFDGYKKEAQKVHKRMNGRYFEELPKQPLNTPYGQYEGGYIPADYDPVESAEADIRSEKSAAESQKEQVNFATTGANFTKSRAQNFSDKLMLDLTRLPMHLDRELRYIHLEEQVRQVGGVLRSREFRKQLEGVAPFVKNILDTWLSAVATQQTYKPTSVAIADKTIETARRNTGVTLMAGNFINAYETLTSLPQILVAVSGKEMAISSAKYFANTFSTKSMTEEVRRLSPFMDTRLDQSMNEYRFQLENFVTNPSLLKKGTDFLHKHAYLLQQLIQVPLEVITWNAAYSEMVAKGMNDADAIHHADGVMRQYLNDMTPEGLSSVERSTPTVRAMLMFFGWFNMVGNTFITNTKLIKENHSGLARYGRYAYMYAMMMALPAILAKALRESINDTLSEDEDDELWDSDMTNILINSQLEMITGMVPFGRDVAKLAMPKTEQNAFYAGRYSVSPLISMIENLSKTGSKIIDTTDDEKTVDYSQLAKGILQATTFTTGVPVTFVQRPLVYATDVLVDEDIEPENGVDVARGLMAGK